MTEEECVKLMVKDLIESQLSAAQIADKYCNCGSSELRDSLIVHLESLRRLYSIKHSLKKILK